MFKYIPTFFVLIVLICSCSSSNEINDINNDNFDRGLLLTHFADNIIIPSYQDFSSKMSDLKSAGDTFISAPNQTNLESLRSSWLDAYKNWQRVEMFNVGKADELQYYYFMNVFPLSVSDLETNISSGNYDLNNPNNHDAQGFPALDYLLYGVAENDTAILEKYTTDTNSSSYKLYLSDVLNMMNNLTNLVTEDWTTTYRDIFINSTSNTATSSLNKLVNDYIFYYEKRLRANKVGIPAGVFSDNTLPEKVEAYFNKEASKELALEALDAFKDVFDGKYSGSANANRSSFKQYLQSLDRNDLASEIENQLEIANTQLKTLGSNFYQQVSNDNSQMLKTYDELQKAVVLLKVDMLQAFSVNVDYVDGDGDG